MNNRLTGFLVILALVGAERLWAAPSCGHVTKIQVSAPSVKATDTKTGSVTFTLSSSTNVEFRIEAAVLLAPTASGWDSLMFVDPSVFGMVPLLSAAHQSGQKVCYEPTTRTLSTE